MKMNIVMPMAGLGSRFQDAGYATPKPLIPVMGKPMYAWATDSLPLEHRKNLLFILLGSQPEFNELKEDVEVRYKKYDPIVLSVKELTRGQSETVLAAKRYIDNDTPLLIHNADTAYKIDDAWLEDLEKLKPDGALLVFHATEKRWSFSREDPTGRVVEVREKVPISNWASSGTYYFAKGSDFVRLSQAAIERGRTEANEFYIAPLYNELISEGGFVKNYQIQQLYCFGTPEDLKSALKRLES